MGMCWYCYWGWPKPVEDIYQKALADLNGYREPLEYGPVHIVWCDENFEDCHIRWCLENFDDYRRDYTDADMLVVRRSLEELLQVPTSVRCCQPEDYDDDDEDERPENHPPPEGIEMVKR